MHSCAVVGLGLIGGSLARDLAARGVRVIGYDRDDATVRAALAEGVIDDAVTRGFAGVEEAEVVVLAVPVSWAVGLLTEAAPRLHSARLVTDVGSTKRRIVQAAAALGLGGRFVGSHPLAGEHRSGWGASREGLFAGARVFVCPTPDAGDAAVEAARGLWADVGALPEVVPAEWHDRHLAWTSHLPQAASTALALALAAEGFSRGELGPGGRDVTRLAGSSPEMWSGILAENADAVVPALAALERRLREIRRAVAKGDQPALMRLLEQGRGWFGQG